MRFWLREIVGYALMLLGLFVFYLVLAFVNNGLIIEGSSLTVIGFIVFRGGIHLLKVAVAARLCLAAHAEQKKQRTPPAPTTTRRGVLAQDDLI